MIVKAGFDAVGSDAAARVAGRAMRESERGAPRRAAAARGRRIARRDPAGWLAVTLVRRSWIVCASSGPMPGVCPISPTRGPREARERSETLQQGLLPRRSDAGHLVER